jgi:NitT/TauT family transport system substrate-binding protein
MKKLCRIAVFIVATSFFTSASSGADRITLGLSWLPQAEYGGFYQALADGTYARHGLDVIIKPGGAQINPGQLLAAGAYDVVLGNSSIALNAIEQKLDFLAVAAFFQQEPTILIAHDDPAINTLADLKGHPAAISGTAAATYWPLLKLKFGFSDKQIRPYPYSFAPFIANPEAIQQGFLTNDRAQLERKGIKVKTFLLADYGYAPYGDLVITTRKFEQDHQDSVQRFVTATSEGWRNFLSGDSSKAKALILAGNADYTDQIFEDARRVIIEKRFVDGGDASTDGIGIMTNERWDSFFKTSVETGVYPPTLDYKNSYTLDFVQPGSLTK